MKEGVQVVVLNSTNVVLTILPSDPTSRQANGGAAVAAEGYFSHESKRFVLPRNYISAVSFPRALVEVRACMDSHGPDRYG